MVLIIYSELHNNSASLFLFESLGSGFWMKPVASLSVGIGHGKMPVSASQICSPVLLFTFARLAKVFTSSSVTLLRNGRSLSSSTQAKVMHQLMHRKLTWEPCFQTLISVGSDNHLYQWQASLGSYLPPPLRSRSTSSGACTALVSE